MPYLSSCLFSNVQFVSTFTHFHLSWRAIFSYFFPVFFSKKFFTFCYIFICRSMRLFLPFNSLFNTMSFFDIGRVFEMIFRSFLIKYFIRDRRFPEQLNLFFSHSLLCLDLAEAAFPVSKLKLDSYIGLYMFYLQ